MKKLLEAITKNPLFVFVGWLGTMIALILAIVVPIMQARKVQLNFSYTSNLLVSDSLSEMEGLDIRFQGDKVEQLTVTTCEICNTGNVTIEDSDVYEGHKLRVFTGSDNAEVLFVSVVSQSYDTNNCQLSYDGNSVNVHFDVLEKKEKVVFNIYHTGAADTAFSIEGKVKEGKIKYEKSSFNAMSRISFLISIVALIMSLLAPLFKKIEKTKHMMYYNSLLMALLGVLIAAVATVIQHGM